MSEREILRQKFKQLIAVTETLSLIPDEKEFFQKLGLQLTKLTGAKSAFVISYYNSSITSIGKNAAPRVDSLEISQPYPANARRWNFLKRGILLSNEASGDARLSSDFVQSREIRNLIAAPIVFSGKIAGLIVLVNKRGGFTKADSDLLSAVSHQAGPMIVNFQLRGNEKRRTHQLNLLSELVTEISLIRNSHQLLKTAVERIQQHFSYYLVAAGWVDEAAREVRFVHVLSRNPRAASKKEIRIPINKTLAGKAIQKGATIYSKNVTAMKSDPLFSPEVKSVMTSPVKIGDSVVAVLEIQSDTVNSFDASDRMVLEAVTSALGSAIQNANAYQNLERINAQLEEASKLKEEILQIVAHDFRSPLTVIRGYMDQLLRKEKWQDLQQKEIMQTVSQQAFRLQKLADATLKASRFDSGDIPFNFEKTDFDSFLQHLVFPWSEKHNFIVKAEKDLPIIKADSGRLQEAMENLLGNAIKYSADGGNVTIRLQKVLKKDVAKHFETEPEQGTFLLVSVSDQGIGIPPGKSDLLFRRFARIHESRRIEGIGLGLYITRKIIEAHGGKIWLKEQGEGACFCFALPEYKSVFEESIIVVEDDTLTLRLLHRAISSLGYEVISAWDGKEAIDKIFRFQPRLIVTDLMLPEINGEELIRRLRLNPDTASIPIIVFTGKRDYNLQHAVENSVRLVFKHQGVGAVVQQIKELLTPGVSRG